MANYINRQLSPGSRRKLKKFDLELQKKSNPSLKRIPLLPVRIHLSPLPVSTEISTRLVCKVRLTGASMKKGLLRP